jgi:hypothetical protein
MLLTLVGGFAGIWLAVTGVRWLRVFGAGMPRQDLGALSIVPRLHSRHRRSKRCLPSRFNSAGWRAASRRCGIAYRGA